MEELPCAILAKGPVWTKASCSSSVWRALGFNASFKRIVIAPATPISSVVTALPDLSRATTIFPIRLRRSSRLVARANTAITSLATDMSKPVSRSGPFSKPPKPMIMLLRVLSFMSTTRRHRTEYGSIFNFFKPSFSKYVSDHLLSWYMRASIAAAHRLCAADTACVSPVRCRLKSVIGTI